VKTTTCSGLETVEYDEADTEDIEITAPVADDRAARLEAIWRETRRIGWWCTGCPHDGGANVCRATGAMNCYGVLSHLLGRQAG
jgi:hypothetical protein